MTNPGVRLLPLIRVPPLALVLGVTGVFAGCTIGLPTLPDPGTPSAAPGSVEARALLESAEPGPDCFQRHLRDAISLNQRRLATYSEWTGGASETVSRRLISAERAALLSAWYVDRRARRFQEAGLTIGCAEFASMSLTPPLGATPPPAPVSSPEAGPDADSLSAALRRAYGAGGFDAVASVADRTLAELSVAPDYHCMVRHLVESVWRVATLAPLHAEAAEAAGLPATLPLSELLLRLHLAALAPGADLDRDAAPLQRAGVPILCRDVPPLR